MLGSNFALLVKSPGNDGQQLLRTGSSYVYRVWCRHTYLAEPQKYQILVSAVKFNDTQKPEKTHAINYMYAP